jgi:hypothetical protein
MQARGVDFDNSDFGFKEERKDPEKVVDPINLVLLLILTFIIRSKMKPFSKTLPKNAMVTSLLSQRPSVNSKSRG